MDKVLELYRKIDKNGSITFSVLGIMVLFVMAYFLGLTESQSRTLTSLEERQDQFAFELPDTNLSRDLYLNLKAAIAVDNKKREVVYSFNADEVRPVASISKILTAMIVLDNYNPDTVLTITKEDARNSARSLFRTGDKVRAKDLLRAAMLQSDNRSARALARHVAGSYEVFARNMNNLAKICGLEHTVMFEPTGLDERNCSTAADVARLLNIAYRNYPELAKIMSLKNYRFSIVNRKKTIRLVNTNRMVYSKYKVKAGKTGYIIESDYCLATILQNSKGEEVTVVILGAPGPNTRFREARKLANYAFKKI
jgi:D-alanyl-D-alanine endopeptidase (penicillin-binding protein 7)